MNVDRNAPCPCGSGKKYKKCCLEQEKKELVKEFIDTREGNFFDEWEPEEDKGFTLDECEDLEEEDGMEDDYEDDEEIEEDEDCLDDDFEEDEEENDNEESSDDLPELSEEDEKLVDDWWNKCRKLKNTVKEREHLVSFMEKYPQLVKHLHLNIEMLFVLGDEHFKAGIYEQFVEILLRIRKEYLEVYKKSYGYYDFDLICWYTAQGRLDEIQQFFNLFNDKTLKTHHKICELMLFFRALNRQDILMAYLTTKKDTETIISNNIFQKYLNKPVSIESAKDLQNEFRTKGLESEISDVKYTEKRLLTYTRPFSQWDENIPKKRSQALDYYDEITDNFAYYLYKNVELTFDSAILYAGTIYSYYKKVVSLNKFPKNLFCLDMNTFKRNIFLKYFDIFDSDIYIIVQLNAFYYFAAYLETCGNINEEQKVSFQKEVTEIYQDYYSKNNFVGPEMLSFEQFPMFGKL